MRGKFENAVTPDGRPYGRPEGFSPRYQAFSARFPETMSHMVFAQLGVQETAADAFEVLEAMRGSLEGHRHAPRHVDRGVFEDTGGIRNHVFMAYWDDPGAYESWSSNEEVRALFDDPSAHSAGRWREIATIPIERTETLHSGENHDNGSSHFVPIDETPTHDYWGAARDRMPASSEDAFESPLDAGPPRRHPDLRAGERRIRMRTPANVCLIRTAQDWSRCNGAEQRTYLEDVEPVLKRGAYYLQDHPTEETGCFSSKYVRETTLAGEPVDKSCVVGFFVSLEHLERWTLSHQTHIDIFQSFYKMLEAHDYAINLALWHEISVLPEGAIDLEYVNCHPSTGFLPFLDRDSADASSSEGTSWWDVEDQGGERTTEKPKGVTE